MREDANTVEAPLHLLGSAEDAIMHPASKGCFDLGVLRVHATTLAGSFIMAENDHSCNSFVVFSAKGPMIRLGHLWFANHQGGIHGRCLRQIWLL